MFNRDPINRIYSIHRPTFEEMLELEEVLNSRFFNMGKAVRCMILAAITGEAMVMIGPPGTAKSRLIRAFCNHIGVLDQDPRDSSKPSDQSHAGAVQEKNERYFEYLLTQFTEPSELFGYFDLAKLSGPDPKLERITKGQMQRAEVVFLDEVFNASSAILNALLTFMNEHKFHDRGLVHDTPLKMLFAATNAPPREEGLGAFYDRFLLRCWMENTPAHHQAVASLLEAAWTETHSHADPHRGKFASLLGDLDRYRSAINDATTRGELAIAHDSVIIAQLAGIIETLRRKELSEMSNRRLVKFSAVVLAQALLRSAAAGEESVEILSGDLEVLLDYGLDLADPSTLEKMRQNLALA